MIVLLMLLASAAFNAWIMCVQPDVETRTVRKNAPRVTWGLQAGAVYGMIHRRPDVYVGIGVTVRIGR